MSRPPYSRPVIDPALATYRGTNAGEWREDIPPEDTAPTWAPDRPSLESWGVTLEEARAMLKRQMCPACGKGPWKSPLNHAAKKHGIDKFTMRDVCGLIVSESVTDPEYRAQISERERGRDMSNVNHAGKPRRKQRWTATGRQRNIDTLAKWEAENPDAALAARSKAGQAGSAARWSK